MVQRSAAFAYLIACLSTLAVAAFRLAIGDFAGDQITLLPFLLSVTIAARYGGFGPGLLATVLGTIASVALFAHPTPFFFIGGVSDQIRLCVFLFIGAVVSYLYAALISARARAEASAWEAVAKQRRLEDADRNKNDFLATLAHEMRNPLAAIQTELAAAQLRELPASLPLSVDLLQRQAFTLTRLTADLFDLSTISRGKMRLTKKPIDLKEAVKSAIEATRPALAIHGHQLETELPEEPLFVVGDTARLTQVFVNLLANSIKYTEHGGRIRLLVSLDSRDAIVRVIDNGIGVSPEHLSRLFELGEQVEKDIERSEGGLGIGLAVVRRIVEMHGGSVVAASEGPGHGCEFTVRLPIAVQNIGIDRGAELTNAIGVSQHKRNCLPSMERGVPRILVVDDHGSIAKTCAAILHDCGCATQFATDSRSAIQITCDFKPDIVLIDINMPQMDGYELARRIKNPPSGKKMTLLAMTGDERERVTERCAEAGFAGRLVKPISIDDLRDIAASWMECSDCGVEQRSGDKQEQVEACAAVERVS